MIELYGQLPGAATTDSLKHAAALSVNPPYLSGHRPGL